MLRILVPSGFENFQKMSCSHLIDAHNRLGTTVLHHNMYYYYTTLFTLLGGDDSDDEEEVDSNNDGGSLQSERTDKDEEACEGKLQATQQTSEADLLTANKLWIKVQKIASWHENHWVCSLEKVTLSGTMRETFQLSLGNILGEQFRDTTATPTTSFTPPL